MKKFLKNKNYLFFAPYLLIVIYYLCIYRSNFSINGGEYEFLLSECIFHILFFSFLEILFYFLFSRLFSDRESFILIQLFLFLSVCSGLIVWLITIFLFVYFLFSKEIHVNVQSFLNVFLPLFFFAECFSFFLVFFFCGKDTVSFMVRKKDYSKNVSCSVEPSISTPNIYWIHMDGMPNTSFIEEFYNEDLGEIKESFEEMGFSLNDDASFVGGHHTLLALNALFNPQYYDEFLHDYLQELDACSLHSCYTEKTVSFREISYHRIRNELFQAFQKKGYHIVGITEFNQYTAFNTDSIYDIWHYDKGDKVPYLSKIDTDEDIYNHILKVHFQNTIENIYGVRHYSTMFDEMIPIRVDLSSYPLLEKSPYYPIQAMIQSFDDARDRNKQPQFYFFDNTMIHEYWNFDKEGNVIRSDNTNLDDFDDCYYYTLKLTLEFVQYIQEHDSDGVIIIQGDHGIHVLPSVYMKEFFDVNDDEVLDMRNSTFSAILIPEEYQNGDEEYLNNPLNISRYLVNNFVGKNYEYLK